MSSFSTLLSQQYNDNSHPLASASLGTVSWRTPCIQRRCIETEPEQAEWTYQAVERRVLFAYEQMLVV